MKCFVIFLFIYYLFIRLLFMSTAIKSSRGSHFFVFPIHEVNQPLIVINTIYRCLVLNYCFEFFFNIFFVTLFIFICKHLKKSVSGCMVPFLIIISLDIFFIALLICICKQLKMTISCFGGNIQKHNFFECICL